MKIFLTNVLNLCHRPCFKSFYNESPFKLKTINLHHTHCYLLRTTTYKEISSHPSPLLRAVAPSLPTRSFIFCSLFHRNRLCRWRRLLSPGSRRVAVLVVRARPPQATKVSHGIESRPYALWLILKSRYAPYLVLRDSASLLILPSISNLSAALSSATRPNLYASKMKFESHRHFYI